MSSVEVLLYPDVDRWLTKVEQYDLDVFGEVLALIDALQSMGLNSAIRSHIQQSLQNSICMLYDEHRQAQRPLMQTGLR